VDPGRLIGHPRSCLDRRREQGRRDLPGAGPKADQPVPAVVRCRERQQDVAPVEGLSMRSRNGTSWSGRCEVLTDEEE
jgi:hypothetical protein